jgi:hypothetical protein
MSSALKVGLPGAALLACCALLLAFLSQLQPLLSTPVNPETPNLSPSEIRTHLLMLRGLAGFTAAGAFFALTAAAWTARPSAPVRAALAGAGWLLRLTTLIVALVLVVPQWQAVTTPGYFDGRARAILGLLLTAVLGLPALILVWTAVSRFTRWTAEALTWTAGSGSGRLQRLFRQLNSSWHLLTALLLMAGLLLVPMVLIDAPHPKAETVSTALDRTVIAQQKPLLIMVTLSLVASGLSAWFLRRAAADRTAQLDRQHSRMDRVLRRPTAEPAAGTAEVP